MKKTLLILLTLMLMLPFVAFGETATTEKPAEKKAFDKTALETSGLYRYDKFEKKWSLQGIYEKRYSNVIYDISFNLFDTYIEKGWGPDLRVSRFDRENENYDTVVAFRALVDGTLYSIEKLANFEKSGFAFGSTGIRAFMNSLKNAKEIAFQVDFTDKFGASYTSTIDPVDILALSELVEMAELFEKSNTWTVVSDLVMVESDALYGVSIE